MAKSASAVKQQVENGGVAPEVADAGEPAAAGLPSVFTQSNVTGFDLSGFKVKRRLTLPTLVLKEGIGYILRIDTKMSISKVQDPDPQKRSKPATVCQVTNMQTGECMQLLVPEVMVRSMLDLYTTVKDEEALKKHALLGYDDTDAYVGKLYAVMKRGKREGKRYHDIEVAELEATANEEAGAE